MLPEKLQHIVDEFKSLTANDDKYQQLLWYAKRAKDFPEEQKILENRVPGCISEVYITKQNGAFIATANSQLVLGLVQIIIEGIQDSSPEQIQQLPSEFLTELGLTQTLTPSRMNAAVNILQMIKDKALR